MQFKFDDELIHDIVSQYAKKLLKLGLVWYTIPPTIVKYKSLPNFLYGDP